MGREQCDHNEVSDPMPRPITTTVTPEPLGTLLRNVIMSTRTVSTCTPAAYRVLTECPPSLSPYVCCVSAYRNMFSGAIAFNKDLCWNVGSETDTDGMFDPGGVALALYPACLPFQPANRTVLKTAVESWCTNSTSATTTHGDINTWDVRTRMCTPPPCSLSHPRNH